MVHRIAFARLPHSWCRPVLHVATLVLIVVGGNSVVRGGAIVTVGTNWSLSIDAGSSGTATASISNVGDSAAEINSFVLAYSLVPVTGSGTLTLVGFDAPVSNPLLTQDPPEYFLLGASSLDAPITVSGMDYYDYYPALAGNTTSYNESLGAGQTRNLGTLTFSASEGTAGTWQVYLANQESPQKSFSSKYPSPDSSFSDLPAINGSSVLVGTVEVVPEPGTSGLLAVAGFLLAGRRCAKRSANISNR